MKQKVMRGISLLLAMLLILSMAACGKNDQPEKDMDAEQVLQSLLKNVTYAAELSQVGDNAAVYFHSLPKQCKVQLYTAGGYYADEVALFTLQDAGDGEAVLSSVATHIAEQRNQFQNYVPKEVGKLDHALTYQSGKYVFLCITDDYRNAEKILKNGGKMQVTTPETENSTLPEKPDGTTPVATAPQQTGYPVLKSKSGTFHDYGNGVIRVDNGAFETYGYSDSAAQSYADIVNKVAASLKGKTKVYALAIPTAVGVVLPDDIAKILPGYTHQGEVIGKIFAKMSDDVIPVNCFDNMMKHRDEYLYFHTDYHWNGRGAYYAYESFCNTKGVAPYPLEVREEKQFGDFFGVLYNKNSSKDPLLAANPDTVHAYYPKSKSASMKFTDRNGKTLDWNIIMDVSDWAKDSKYSTFAGADNPIAVFTNPEVTDGSVCVVVKESYGNALLPYLVDHYSTIYEIDYRYWQGNLLDFVQEKSANDLIFANNLTMIATSSLIGMLAKVAK